MTESEWLVCSDLGKLLAVASVASERKLRLFQSPAAGIFGICFKMNVAVEPWK